MRKVLSRILIIADVIIVTGFVLAMAFFMGHFQSDFPAGLDTYAYLTRIRFILDWFPYINWNPFWDSGVPFWLWSHPPLSMIVASLLVKIFSITPEASLIYLAAGSFVLLGLGIYGFAYHLTESRLASLLTVILMLASPASWGWWNGGNYTRVFGFGFLGLSLFFISGHLKFYEINQRRGRWFYLGAIFSSGIVYMSHLLSGGLLALLTLALIFFSLKGIKEKLKVAFKLVLPALLLAAYWYLPLFLTSRAGSRFFGKNPVDPIPWSYLWVPKPYKDWNFALTPVYLSLFLPAIASLIIGLIIKGRKSLPKFGFSAWLGFFLVCLGNFVYNFVGHLSFYPERFYINGFPPTSAFPAFALFFGASIGILIGLLVKLYFPPKMALRTGVILTILIFTLGGLILNFDYLRKGTLLSYNVGDPESLNSLSQKVIQVELNKDYRFGTDSSFVADWFNYKYAIPQTRDYFSQGIPYPDWLAWFEKTVWFWEDNYEETGFLLDWYAVRQFFVSEPHFKYYKFLNRKNYKLVNSEILLYQTWGPLPFYEFSQLHSGPILAANNTPAVLFIGKGYDYNVFFRALALTGLDSQNLVPIKGRELIDSYSLDELKPFKAVFLYNYRYRNQKKAFELLADYVKEGGNLWLEVANTPERNSESLPEVFPVNQTTEKEITDWHLKRGKGLALLIDLKKIPPPDYEGAAWKAVMGSEIRTWAKPVLLGEEKVLFAEGKLGKGEVVWSGMNFPFHLTTTRNLEETKLLSSIFKGWATFEENVVSGQANFIHPEKREIVLTKDSRGVLFKESFFQNWHAYAETERGRKRLEILRAGPDLMYVFLPQGAKKIIFEYHISWIEKLGWIISFITFVLLILYALELLIKMPFFSQVTVPFRVRLGGYQQTVSSWWEKEREE